MRFTVIAPPTFQLPRGHAFVSALMKGALAFQEGKPRNANPYKESRGGFGSGFCNEWDRGWGAMQAGILKIEWEDTARRWPKIETR